MNELPKISIVTPSFNQGRFLEKTILSVLEQGYPNLEYIIIDGGSTDESVEIIKKYEHRLSYWVSEPDRGQSHAINKGFEQASGEIFAWLNSDDWYYPEALKTIAEAFTSNPDVGAVVGAGDMLDEAGNELNVDSFNVSVPALHNWIERFFMQPSCFFRAKIWKECGPLAETIDFAMDLDLWLKIAKTSKFMSIDNNLSASLVHKSAKTTAHASSSIVDAALVIMGHGGEKEGRKKLASYLDELFRARVSLEVLENLRKEKSGLAKENHRLNSLLQVKQKRIDALENSLSWRLTSPLRRLLSTLQWKQGYQKGSQYLVGPSKTVEDIADALDECTSSSKRILLLDFSLGGGSELYSQNFTSYFEESGHRVVTLKYNFSTKRYNLALNTGDRVLEATLSTEVESFFYYARTRLGIDLIFVNQLVSWPNIYATLDALKKVEIPYSVLIHDYFFVCPNYNLFNHYKEFCSIPDDQESCKQCLKAVGGIDFPFHHYADHLEIRMWREEIGSFLASAERVVGFSQASLSLLKKVYPSLVTVVNEHYIPDDKLFEWKQREFDSTKPLTIAVLGRISVAKGREFLKNLSKVSTLKKFGFRIVVIGEICPSHEFHRQTADFIVHGAYNRHELGKLLENYGASLVFVPSLCPETFCYTASEALLLGYPVMCFDLGAQAERVKGCECGWVLGEPYFEQFIQTVHDIVHDPRVVGEMSSRTLRYRPPTDEEHFNVFDHLIAN